MASALAMFLFILTASLMGWMIMLLINTKKRETKINTNITVRGMNGSEKVGLVCPVNQKISIQPMKLKDFNYPDRAVCICSNDVNGIENSNTDSFYSPNGAYYNSNSVSVLSDIQKKCEGKNSCDYIIPSLSDLQKINPKFQCNGKIQMIGTYDCIPQ